MLSAAQSLEPRVRRHCLALRTQGLLGPPHEPHPATARIAKAKWRPDERDELSEAMNADVPGRFRVEYRPNPLDRNINQVITSTASRSP